MTRLLFGELWEVLAGRYRWQPESPHSSCDDACEFLDAIPGLCDGSWWAFSEFLFQRLRERGQFVDTSFLMKLTYGVQPTCHKTVQHSLHRTPRTSGQFGNPVMNFTMHFKPKDLHSLLHTRVRMVKPVPDYRCTLFFHK